MCDGDEPPISFSEKAAEGLGLLLLRSLNDLLVLPENVYFCRHAIYKASVIK